MKNLIIVCLLFVGFAAQSQSLLVPYRKGNQWGLCDTLGKVVLKPAYDDVRFGDRNDFPRNYFIAEKNGKQGVVTAKKEIIKPEYNRVVCADQTYFIAYRTESYDGELFKLNGDKMEPEGYEIDYTFWIYGRHNINERATHFVFRIKDKNGLYGVYGYDVLKPERSRILLQGYDRIKKNGREELYSLTISAQKTDGSSAEPFVVTYNEVAGDFVVTSGTKVPSQNNRPELVMDMEVGISADDLPIPVIEREGGSPPSAYVPVHIKYNAEFRKSADTILIDYKVQYDTKNPKARGTVVTRPLKLPEGAGDFVIVKPVHINNIAQQYGDTLALFQNYLVYTVNGKKGLAVSEKPLPAIYDSLLLIKVSENLNSHHRFIFGIKKDNKTQYGLMDTEGKVIIEPIYDEIVKFRNDGLTQTVNYSDRDWIVKQRGKLGIITPKNEILVPAIYDEIQQYGKLYDTPIFRVLKKDNLYGVYYKEMDGIYSNSPNFILLEPFSKHRITEMEFVPRTHEKHRNYFTLLLLTDENGKKVGYVNKGGLKYFKD